MYALTLHQPWAWLISVGIKKVENRNWAPPDDRVGKFFAIHAGKKYDQEAHDHIESRGIVIPEVARTHGAIVCVARLVSVMYEEDPEKANAIDSWFFGPYGWKLDDVIPLDPVPCRGMQKLWRVPDEIARQVEQDVKLARRARL